MLNPNLKSCDDILSYISYLERKENKLDNELASLKYRIFSRTARQRRKELKREKKELTQTLASYEEFLHMATTFQKSDLVYLFSQYFTALYNKEYAYIRNIKDKSEGTHWVPTDFIASRSDFKRLERKFRFKRKVDLDKVIDKCCDTCLCLGGPEEYTLLEGAYINEDLEGFPELVDMIKSLVDIRLSNPDLSNKRILALGLKKAIANLQNERKEKKEETVQENIPSNFNPPIVETDPKYESHPVIRKNRADVPVSIKVPDYLVTPTQEREETEETKILKKDQSYTGKELVLRKSIMSIYTRKS